MKVDKNLFIFLASAVTLIASIFLIQQSLLVKQDQTIANQDYLINRINEYNKNRTEQLIAFQNNITADIIKNQGLIKGNQEVIKNLTNSTLYLAKTIADNFGEDYLKREAFQYKQANDTFNLINTTLNGVRAHEELDNYRFKNYSLYKGLVD